MARCCASRRERCLGGRVRRCRAFSGVNTSGVLVEADLSFFGIGVQSPEASWGVVLRRSFESINKLSFQSLPPALAVTILILALQFLGDGMRDSLGKEIRSGK